jgi:hypothetical protein
MNPSPDTRQVELEAAPAAKPKQIVLPATEAVDETLYLTGRPTMKSFLRFVRREAVEPEDEATLIQEWQAAKNHIEVLEKEEAGYADNPVIHPIPIDAKYKPLLVEFLADPLVRHGFNTVPTEVAFVELDQLVVYQKHIDLTFVQELKKKLGPAPSDEEIFRTCLPYDHPHPPAKWSRVSDDSFVFVSPSNDIRYLQTMRLEPDHIEGYPHPGALVGVVGLAVGFGSNFLNAIYVDNRLVLNNGSHRAYTLREMGFTHVPCVVQHVSTRDELDVLAASAIRRHPDFFLKGQRPSMLKDYFNPKLHKVVPVRRQLKQITIKFQIEERYVPAL